MLLLRRVIFLILEITGFSFIKTDSSEELLQIKIWIKTEYVKWLLPGRI